jgi:hypothetical protein
MVVVRQVQEAGYWVIFYSYAAQNMTITGVSGFPLVISWIDIDTSQKHKVVFSVNSSGLKGSCYVADVFDSAKTGKIPVFGLINPDTTKTNCRIGGGSDFSLPDVGDAFKITGGPIPDNGMITCVSGSISVTTTGEATYSSGTGAWTTNTTGDTIQVTATSVTTKGSWSSETMTVTAGITVDSDEDATLDSAHALILTLTATAGGGQQQKNETRTYLVVPKPES